MKSMVVGMGEIGQAVYALFKTSHSMGAYDLNGYDEYIKEPDVLHICYPYTEDFVKITKNYIWMYKPKLTIVYSTTLPGTCNKIGKDVVHSPIEGKHPFLLESIRVATRWIGCKDRDTRNKTDILFTKLGLKTFVVEDSKYTEVLKISSTTKYLWNINYARIEGLLAKKIKMPFRYFNLWDQDYNDMYSRIGLSGYNKPILHPPMGNKIGGHCLISNFKMLKKYIRLEDWEVLDKYEQEKRTD